MKQATIKKAFTLSGRGLHAGQTSVITISPADTDSGLTVTDRKNIKGGSFALTPFCVSDTKRGTTVKHKRTVFHTVEHLVSALRGTGVTNAKIEIEQGNEPPIFDGSGIEIAKAAIKAGIVKQKKDLKEIVLKEPVLYKENGSYIAAIPSDAFRVTYYSDFSAKGLAPQHADFKETDDYLKLVAPARTFGFKKEIEWLIKSGLIKGADTGSAILFGENGVPENTKLRFKTEPAMHKVLDMIGDLGLINAHLKAHVIAYKTGHRHNVELAKKITKLSGGN